MDENLEESIARMVGVVPASQLAEMLDDDDLARKININRAKDIAARVSREGVGAFSTYALLNILENPALFGGSIMLDAGLEMAQYKAQAEFDQVIISKVLNKLLQLSPYYRKIKGELQERGHQRPEYWRAFGDIITTERVKFGLDKSMVLSRPVTQAFSAIGQIPYLALALATGVTYASLPLSSRIGERDKLLEDRTQAVEESRNRAELYRNDNLREELDEVKKSFWDKRNLNELGKILFGKIPDVSFLGASIIAQTESLGIFRYISQLFSTPVNFRNLRKRELEIKRSLGFVRSLYEIISGDPYFLTNKSWDIYRQEKLDSLEERLELSEPGIQLVSLETLIPDKSGERYTPPLSCSAKPGEIILLHGESGEGKSVTTGMGLAGLVRTRGEIYFQDREGPTKLLEDLDREDIQKRIWYVSPTLWFDEIRVCDIYQRKISDHYLENTGRTKEELSEYEIMMLTLPDALLEKELYAQAKAMKKRGEKRNFYGYDDPEGKRISLKGVKPVFPESMFSEIYAFREDRNKIVKRLLEQEDRSNYASIDPASPIGTLSTGMKIRFMWDLYHEMHGNGDQEKTKIVVIDEPFGSLDKKNASEYMSLIKEFSEAEYAPVIMLISHTHKDMVREQAGPKLKEIYFDPKQNYGKE